MLESDLNVSRVGFYFFPEILDLFILFYFYYSVLSKSDTIYNLLNTYSLSIPFKFN